MSFSSCWYEHFFFSTRNSLTQALRSAFFLCILFILSVSLKFPHIFTLFDLFHSWSFKFGLHYGPSLKHVHNLNKWQDYRNILINTCDLCIKLISSEVTCFELKYLVHNSMAHYSECQHSSALLHALPLLTACMGRG